MEILQWQKHWPHLQRLPLCVLLDCGKVILGITLEDWCLIEKDLSLHGFHPFV